MNICMLTYEFPHSFDEAIVSGEIKNPFYLAYHLSLLGHNVYVISLPIITKKYNKQYAFGNINVFTSKEGFSRNVLLYITRGLNVKKVFYKILKSNKIDIIHSHVPSLSIGLEIDKMFKKLNIPLVTTAHGTYLPELYANIDNIEYKPLKLLKIKTYGKVMSLCDSISFGNSDIVISVSNYQVKEMVDIYKLPKRKIKVIYNGVDSDIYINLIIRIGSY